MNILLTKVSTIIAILGYIFYIGVFIYIINKYKNLNSNYLGLDLYATCGIINLDYRFLVHHFECGVWMYNTEYISNMKKEFLKTKNNLQVISKKEAKLKGLKN